MLLSATVEAWRRWVEETGEAMSEWSAGRLDELNNRVDVLGAKVDTVGGRVEYLSGRVEGLAERVEELGRRTDCLTSRVDRGFIEGNAQFAALHRMLFRISVGAAVGVGVALIAAILA